MEVSEDLEQKFQEIIKNFDLLAHGNISIIAENKKLLLKTARYEKFRLEVRRRWVNDFGDSMVDVYGLDKALKEEE